MASPCDFSKVPLVAPLRPIAAVTRGGSATQLYRVLGGAPAPLVKRGYQLAGIDKYVMKPLDGRLQPRRPRAARPDRGGRRASWAACTPTPGAPSASSTTASSAPTTSPTGGSRSTDRDDRPRRRDASRCSRSPGAATGSRRVAACHHVGDLRAERRGGAARDGAGRPPRRAHRPRGARDTTWPLLDAFLDAHRRCSRAAAPEALTLARHAPSARSFLSPPRCLPAARRRPVEPVHPGRRDGRRHRPRRPDVVAGGGEARTHAFAAPLGRSRSSSASRAIAACSTRRRSASCFDPRGPPGARTRGAATRRARRPGRRAAARDLRRREAGGLHGGARPRLGLRPRSAKLKMTIRRMMVRRARMGWSIDEQALAQSLDPLLADPCAPPRSCASSGCGCTRAQRHRPAQRVPGGAHDRPRELQAALLQEPQAPARRYGDRRRHARLRDADRPLLDPQQGRQPGLERARRAVGRRLPQRGRRRAARRRTR